MNPLRIAFELIRYRPVRWTATFVMWTVIHASPIVMGVLIGSIFDRLDAGNAAESPWTPLLVFAAIAMGRNGVLWVGDVQWIAYWNEQVLQLRRNILRWLLLAPRSRTIIPTPGEAVSTFRDDVDDLVEYVENLVDAGGLILFAVGSVAVMITIDPAITGLVLVPLVLTIALTQLLSPQIRSRRRAMREATEDVTGFIGETFGAISTVKLADAGGPVLDRFETLNERRRHAALRDTFLTEVLRSINSNMATVGSGIVLIVSAGSIGTADFTVGDLAIFLTYLPRLTNYMAFAGDILAQHRRTGVAYERIKALAVDASDTVLLDRDRVPLEGEIPEPAPVIADAAAFRSLRVEGLTFDHVDGAPGIHAVDFRVDRGEFVVFTGKIGSGKSSLMRAVLGLVPATGVWYWNDEIIDDPAAFLVPPRTAYTSQVPRLFSDSLGNNIALGRRVPEERMREAVSLAVLEPDLERMEHGLETAIGARGVKLSGGQVQRSAAARMFATEAELLVFDDLSSALDVHTEAELWQRLFARRDVTCLVVSHRRSVLRRADRIVLLDGGKVVDRGTLDELLQRQTLMRDLWQTAV